MGPIDLSRGLTLLDVLFLIRLSISPFFQDLTSLKNYALLDNRKKMSDPHKGRFST
jgi:hypothetical protein